MYIWVIFPSDFRDSLDRKLTFAQSGGDAVIGTRIFFVSLVLNLVPIRQERSQPNRADTLTFTPRLLQSSEHPKLLQRGRQHQNNQPCRVFKNRTWPLTPWLPSETCPFHRAVFLQRCVKTKIRDIPLRDKNSLSCTGSSYIMNERK